MNETLQDLSALAEIISAVAVVATLAYLAIQIRQNTKTMRAMSAASHTDTTNEIAKLFAQNPEQAEVFYRVRNDPESLTDMEKEWMTHIFGMMVNYMQQADELAAVDALPAGFAQKTDAQIEFMVSLQSFDAWFNEYGAMMCTPGFQSKVEGAMTRRAAKESNP
jgi:hypothetical protein